MNPNHGGVAKSPGAPAVDHTVGGCSGEYGNDVYSQSGRNVTGGRVVTDVKFRAVHVPGETGHAAFEDHDVGQRAVLGEITVDIGDRYTILNKTIREPLRPLQLFVSGSPVEDNPVAFFEQGEQQVFFQMGPPLASPPGHLLQN